MKTTLYTVLCIAIRLAAILMAAGLIADIPAYLWGSQDRFLSMIALGALIVGLLIAVALWLWPGLLARWAEKGQNSEVVESAIEADQIQYIALSVLGGWLLISGLASGLQQGAALLMLHARGEVHPIPVLLPNLLVALVKSSVTMVAGGVLMLGSRGLVGLLHRLRGYPHYRTSVATDPDASTTQDG